MFSLIQAKLLDPQFLAMILVAIGTAATVWTLALPLVESDGLSKRMKAVATERERIRARERERLARAQSKPSLRQEPKAYMRQVVNQFRLARWLGTETARMKLTMAGYRGQQAEITFLFFRLVTPIGFFLASSFYLFVLKVLDYPTFVLTGIVIASLYAGIKAPEVFLTNTISKRKASITAAWPDALDLLLICVESGMSIEAAFRRVSAEIGSQSVPLAEELTLTTAELSYLQDRKTAYENLAKRTDLDGVKSVCMALQQAEKYGTPLAQTLRVMSQENRDMRMSDAEKKAAGLPPKLTVPMILFFLPALFVVILGPATIRVMQVSP